MATLDLTAIGPGDVAAGVAPVDLATVARAVDLLYVTADGASVVVGQGDHLDVVDGATGTRRRAARTCPGWSTSPTAAAARRSWRPSATSPTRPPPRRCWPSSSTGTRRTTRRLLASPGPTVVMGAPGSEDTRDKVEAAIDDGRLAGMAVQDLPRIAAATAAGVTFVDPATASIDLDDRR